MESGFEQLFRAEMKRQRWNFRRLAAELGVSHPTIIRWIKHPPQKGRDYDAFKKLLGIMDMTLPPQSDSGARLQAVNVRSVPLYGTIPAGSATLFDQEPIELIAVPGLEAGDHFALRVKGTSMFPEYHERDVVICRRVEGATMPPKEEGPTPLERFLRFDGRVCAVLIDNEVTLKRIEITRSSAENYQLVLRPLNPEHRTVSVGEKNSFAIQGEVVKLLRDV